MKMRLIYSAPQNATSLAITVLKKEQLPFKTLKADAYALLQIIQFIPFRKGQARQIEHGPTRDDKHPTRHQRSKRWEGNK